MPAAPPGVHGGPLFSRHYHVTRRFHAHRTRTTWLVASRTAILEPSLAYMPLPNLAPAATTLPDPSLPCHGGAFILALRRYKDFILWKVT